MSDIPGTYAPPAVALPNTTEIVVNPASDRLVISRKLAPANPKVQKKFPHSISDILFHQCTVELQRCSTLLNDWTERKIS